MFDFKSKNIDWRLVARYLSGECSPEEKAVIDARLAQDSAYREVFLEARDAWEVTRWPDEGIDQERAWKTLLKKIEHRDDPPISLKLVRQNVQADRRGDVHVSDVAWMNKSSWRFAITTLVLLVGALVVYQSTLPVEHPPTEDAAVFKTRAGQRASITLPDGSEAILNAESQIQLLSFPGDSLRMVRLEGEAFFNVHSDPSRPFIIQARHAEVAVLGTSFNMEAYPETAGIQVAVTEGVVELRNSEKEEALILQRNTIGVVEAGESAHLVEDVSIEHLLAWKQGQLIFERTGFDEVKRTLERWFDLEIHTTTDLSHHHLTATFKEPKPNDVVAIVANTFGLDYTIHENIVTFTPRVNQ